MVTRRSECGGGVIKHVGGYGTVMLRRTMSVHEVANNWGGDTSKRVQMCQGDCGMHSEGRYMCAFRLLTTRLGAEKRQWRCTWAISERGQKCNVGRQETLNMANTANLRMMDPIPLRPRQRASAHWSTVERIRLRGAPLKTNHCRSTPLGQP